MKIIKIACLIIITLCSYIVFISIYRDYNDKIIRNIAYKDKIAENSITDSLIVSLEENKDNLEEKLENEFNIKLDEDIDNLIKDDSLTATDQENLYNECAPKRIIKDLNLYYICYEDKAKFGHFIN